MDRGTYIEHGGRPAVRFIRSYDRPAERLWSAVTEPDELSLWFPAKVAMEHRAGGPIEFSGDPNMPAMTGSVLIYDPPRRLAFSWGASELHFELEARGEHRCVLTLTDVLDAENAAARNAAGWQVCLAELTKHMTGLAADGPHSAAAQSWQACYESYVAAGMPSGAAIPGN
jgi:uncharacterized protein YndB with AHSA1/START domain